MPDEPRDRGLHRHGDPDPSQWNEQETVTGRPNDEAPENSTLASRSKKSKAKKVDADDVEDKAVTAAKTKTRRRG